MRQDTGVDGDAQRISQLVWLLFLKIFDSKEEENELYPHYKPIIPAGLRWRDWASNSEGITGDELLNFVNNTLFETLKNQELDPTADPRAFMVRDIFRDSYNYMKSGTLMRQVINKINEINFQSLSERHLFNDIYEKILRDLQNAGNAGEFYTPRPVTQFMTDMVNPQLGEKVLDPACGTGGFLVCALENLRSQVRTVEQEKLLQNSVRGIEKKPLPHLLALTNLILHDISAPDVRRDNALTLKPLKSYPAAGEVEVILTNPPFGGIEEPGVETGFPAEFQTKETADLFLVLLIKLLKNNGRSAIVLPDGTLFGEGIKTKVKKHLLETCNLHTIVRLPNGVFAPYTGIRTNLLFFTKGEPTKEIWYFEHPMPGDRKQYSKTRPITLDEFELEKSWWFNRVENEQAWRVGLAEIVERNYNLDIKNPHTIEAEHQDPYTLWHTYQEQAAQLAHLQEQLRAELQAALEQTQR